HEGGTCRPTPKATSEKPASVYFRFSTRKSTDPQFERVWCFGVDSLPGAAVAVEMLESRVVCGIPKRGGNGGKVGVGLFRGFHGASFPERFPLLLGDERSELEYHSRMAGLSRLPARDQREGKDPEVVGAAQAREPQASVLRLRAAVQRSGGSLRTGGSRSALVGVQGNRGD